LQGKQVIANYDTSHLVRYYYPRQDTIMV